MRDWYTVAQQISTLDGAWIRKARQRLREQTRPERSLGLLEPLMERLVAIQKTNKPRLKRKRILIFAGDHGVAEQGVSAYPREVTAGMVMNFMNGGATINALARAVKAEIRVVDIGVDANFKKDPRLTHAKIARGTKNFMLEPAMTAGQLEQALETGWEQARQAKEDGYDILALGEMGIGNTTAASAIAASLLQCSPDLVTGRGTGLNEEALENKIKVIETALDLHRDSIKEPLDAVRCLGGFEIAALVGAILSAAHHELAVVIDGWIVSAAALVAIRMNPKTLAYLFFSHQSEEAGHRSLLGALEVHPMLNLSMRLGEASGAALALGILEASVRIYNETATFKEAGVAGHGN